MREINDLLKNGFQVFIADISEKRIVLAEVPVVCRHFPVILTIILLHSCGKIIKVKVQEENYGSRDFKFFRKVVPDTQGL